MAEEILNTIRAQEKSCAENEKNARSLSEQKLAQTKAEADRLIEKTIDDANKQAQKRLQVVKGECEHTIENAVKKAEKQCDAISETAEKNRLKVIKGASDILF